MTQALTIRVKRLDHLYRVLVYDNATSEQVSSDTFPTLQAVSDHLETSHPGASVSWFIGPVPHAPI